MLQSAAGTSTALTMQRALRLADGEAKLDKLGSNITQRALMPFGDRRRSRLASRTNLGLISAQ